MNNEIFGTGAKLAITFLLHQLIDLLAKKILSTHCLTFLQEIEDKKHIFQRFVHSMIIC